MVGRIEKLRKEPEMKAKLKKFDRGVWYATVEGGKVYAVVTHGSDIGGEPMTFRLKVRDDNWQLLTIGDFDTFSEAKKAYSNL